MRIGGGYSGLGAVCAALLSLSAASVPAMAFDHAPAPAPKPAAEATQHANSEPTGLDQASAFRFAGLALDCVHKEFPNKISHVFSGPEDLGLPSALYPVFYGCFDWHSAVHGHWLLIRTLRLNGEGEGAAAIKAALEASFTPEKIAGEVAYMKERKGFERPYGIAWFLTLMQELREWDDPTAKQWASRLAPLEAQVVKHFTLWLPDLAYPVRIGTHNQLAFALTLALDWSRVAQHTALEQLVVETAKRFYATDRNCPLAYEPSGEDFLSPCLMEADLMRRVLNKKEFAVWLTGFLPTIPTNGAGDWLRVGIVNNPEDGKLVHLDGVNLSRAWNLRAIAEALPADDPRIKSLKASADIHQAAGVQSISSENYQGSHWLGSFATYLLTKRYR